MLVTFLPASALAIGPEVGAEGLDEEAVAPVEEETEPVGEPAEPDNGAYSALKQAIEAASDGKETTVTLAGDIAGMTTEQIITIPENKNIILDMEGHSITVASDFTGRPIVNKGTLTVTGNGTIDASASKTGGYGAIDNCGTLTIENGTYTGSVDASGASIKNRPDSVLKIQDGTFNGAMTAVYNAGKTYIYDGTFDCRSCSSCNSSSWGYTIQSHQDSEESAKPELYFYNGTVIGVQGAFSTSAGYSEVRDGEFKTVACDKHSNGSSAFYALYVAGESGEVECNVYGSEFTSISKVAAFVGNSNDGGDKEEALVHIYGGSFISQSDDKEAVHVDEALGGLEIAGGTFSSDVSDYLAKGFSLIANSDGTFGVDRLNESNAAAVVNGTYYGTLAEAVGAAQDGQTVTVLKDLATAPVTTSAGITLDLGGHTLRIVSDTSGVAYGLQFTAGTGVVKNGTVIDMRGEGKTAQNVIALNVTGTAKVTTSSVEFQTYQPRTLVSPYYNKVVEVSDGGTLTLDAGTVLRDLPNGDNNDETYGAIGVSIMGAGGESAPTTLTVNEGTRIETGSAAIMGNGTKHNTVININGGELTGTDGYAIYHPQSGELNITGGRLTGGETGIEIRAGKLNLSGDAVITAKGIPTTTTPNGSGTTTVGAGIAVTQHTTKLPLKVNISGGTISGYTALYQSNPEKNDDDALKKVELNVTGGTFVATNSGTLAVYSENKTSFISGGRFSFDPSDYVTEGKIAVAEDGMYGIQDKNTTAAEVVAGEPEVKAADGIGESVTQAVAKTEATGLTGEANGEANTNTVTVDAGKKALQEKHIDTEGKTVTIVVQPYLDIKVDSYSNTEMKLDITPMVRTVATTADVDKNGTIILEGGEKNAVVMEDPKPMNVTTNVTLRVPLPSGFRADNLYVEHAKDNGRTYLYKATVTESSGSNTATFTTRHGFSTFTLKADVSPAAEIDGTYYETLQDAVNNVQDGQTIRLEQDVSGTVTVSREVTFSIDTNEKKFNPDDIIAGSGYRVSHDGNTFTVVEESHGGSSSSGSTRYTVSVEDTDNGSVKVSPTRASKGSTVTVTVKPDEGYELDELTVTDKNGDSVKLTDKGDGKYTFQMPASKVTVEAVFTAVEPEPEGLPFTDVTSGDWFYDAVAYVYDKGMMEGTTDTTFAPTMNLTRSMIAQVLYNLEERPEAPGAAGFTDVAAGAWYADAVNWAAARGIVKGYDTGAFGPEDSVTREQLAAILYRYAQVKGYDTTQGGMAVREFSDSASISDWAQEAMAWAVNAQVLSGKGNGVLDPQGTATRAEVAQMLMNFVEHVG